MKVSYKIFSLPFIYPFTISKGTKTHQPTFIVELDFMGFKGYGEAPAISYYHIPVEKIQVDLLRQKAGIENYAFTEPQSFWHYLHFLFPENSFLVCALDMAAWDLYGKLNKKPLYELWHLDISKAPLTDYTVGIDTIPKMVEKMKANPWPVYKIKTGVEQDVEMIAELREHTNAVFRADANEGWTLEQAQKKIPLLKMYGVELIGQPLSKKNWEGMEILFNESSIPLIADESCVAADDVKKCHNFFHGINIKLTKCGGITPALKMIKKARELGMKIMLGSMNETTIGSAALAHLSPLCDYLDNDGTLLLKEHIGTEFSINEGKMNVSNLPGLGVIAGF